MKTRALLPSLWMLALLLLAAPGASAQQGIPQTIAYQGYLTNADGDPAGGSAPVTFRLYDDDADGAEVWREVQSNVPFTDGVFSVRLGTVEPLHGVSFTRPLWLSVAVGDGAELAPRIPLSAVPYAMSLHNLRIRPGESPQAESPNLIGGHVANDVANDVSGATIGGGGLAAEPNVVAGNFGTVGGGANNQAGEEATVGGGASNLASGEQSTIGGGSDNEATGQWGTVSGGQANIAEGVFSNIAGGSSNRAGPGQNANVAGGISNRAQGAASAVGGGAGNLAVGEAATVPGGIENRATGRTSLAAGRKAKALHDGAFVWADRTDEDFASTNENQFLIRAQGGVGIGTNAPKARLHLTEVPLNIDTGGITKDVLMLEGFSPLVTLYGKRLQENARSGLILAGVDDNGAVVDRWGIVRQFFPGNGLHFTFGANTAPTQNPSLMILSENADGTALNVSGTVFGERLLATQNLGATATPSSGGHYRDNVVYAWAEVGAAGQFVDGFGCTVERTDRGLYRLTLRRALPNGVSVIVTPRGLGSAFVASAIADGTRVEVAMRRFAGSTFDLTDNAFYVQVVGRP